MNSVVRTTVGAITIMLMRRNFNMTSFLWIGRSTIRRNGVSSFCFVQALSLSTQSHSKKTRTQYPLADRLIGLDQPTVWHEFSPLASQHKSINLGQGFPDWNPPEFCINAMKQSIDPKYGRNANQYARSYAHMPLAQVLAQDYEERWKDKLGSSTFTIDASTQIATATGVTNVLYCAIQGLINPGDEVILLEPYFDIYSSQVQMAGGKCVYCPLRPDFSKTEEGASAVFTLDMNELESKITTKTKALIINTPHNPTGKVFSKQELEQIANIISKYPQIVVISDEVYEHIIFDPINEPHISIATINNGQIYDQTLTMSSSGKTFSCTGWKVGWAIGPPHLVRAVTAVQQWCNFSPVTPTQDAIAQIIIQARNEPYVVTKNEDGEGDDIKESYRSYYEWLANDYKKKRRLLIDALKSAGMTPIIPNGGFFIMADTSTIDFPYDEIATTQTTSAMPATIKMPRDWALARFLTQTVKVTAIPPSAFYSLPNIELAKNTLRFAFCKDDKTILKAHERLQTFFSTSTRS